MSKLQPVKCGCGGEAIVDQTDGYDEYQVYCPKCFMSSGTFNTETEAITAWNKAMGADHFREVTKKVERKTGEWKVVAFLTSKCSECGEEFHELEATNFCPNCGADMRGE